MKVLERDRLPKLLFTGYLLMFVLCAFYPYDRSDWWAENLPIVAIAVTLAVLHIKGIRFSTTAYVFMAVLPYMHTVGGYYTFERVPFGLVNNLFGFQRNMYDRFAHFSVGLYAYAICEACVRYKLVRNKAMMFLFSLFAIGFAAMGYELIEWIFAVTNGGSAGLAFLGSQGDIWDAQKDMLMDTLGALLSILIFLFLHKRNSIAE